MPALSVQNLKMSFGERTLFENVSFQVEKKDKIGFIGGNGVGKTTLFRLLIGEISPDSGTLSYEKGLKPGYMEQHACSDPEEDIYHELLSVFEPLKQLEKEIETLNKRIDEKPDDLESLIIRQTALIERFEKNGGLTYQSRTRSALLGLGFKEEEFSLPVGTLSGGQRSKLSLLKLLLSESGLLLLDEPTNHLDIPSLSWLEGFLSDFKGAMILISHDRYFLDRVTNKTVELAHGKTICYSGSYSVFLKKKEAIQLALQRKYENDQKEIRRIEKIVEQQRRFNREKNIIAAESRLKDIERIKADMVTPDQALETIKLRFEPKYESGNEVLTVKNLSKSFGEKPLFQNVDFLLRKGERVFILGENGCGKTTLFKILMRQIKHSGGDFVFGASVTTGYFDQLFEDLHLDRSAFDQIREEFPALSDTYIRTALARFLFKGDEVFKPLLNLSGGERARVSLLKLMLKGANLLLLDEPTNHLDAASREQLENTLLHYSGTLLIVSHDRYFINKLADRVLYLDRNGVSETLGNYDDFHARQKSDTEPKNSEVKKKKEKPKNEWALKKQQASDERKRQTQLKKAEAEIERLDNEIAQIQDELKQDETAADYEKLMALTSRLEQLENELSLQYERWESLLD